MRPLTQEMPTSRIGPKPWTTSPRSTRRNWYPAAALRFKPDSADMPAEEKPAGGSHGGGKPVRTGADDDSVKVIVLRGEGKHFQAGADLKERNGMTDEQWRVQHAIFEEAYYAIMNCTTPVIAAVNGAAIGGGLCLALAADIRISTPSCQLSIMEARWGLVPLDTASPQQALQWVQAGQRFDLAILDMHMPGLDGVQLAQHIRAAGHRLFDGGVLFQQGFNFSQFNPKPPEFYLVINATQKLQGAIDAIASQVTSFVKAIA
mgnify:CR=1 FL=1